MAKLNEQQILSVKGHMLHEEAALKQRFKTKKNQFDAMKVPHSEVEQWEKQGWIVENRLKTKTCLTKKNHMTDSLKMMCGACSSIWDSAF